VKTFSDTINVSFPFLPIVQFYPLELGHDYGIFKKYGLNVNVKVVSDAAIAAALSSGAVQFHITSPPLELAYAAGVPIKLIGVYGNHTQTYLAAAPGIKSIKDLVGKKIGITAPNGYSAIIAKWALHNAGVPFDKVSFVPMGMTMPSQALVSGLADAVDSDTTQLLLAQKGKAGVTSVENFTSVLWPSGQIWGDAPWMNAHKQETAVFLKAFNAAVVMWNNDPAAAKKEIAKYNNTNDTAVINALYNATKAEFNTGSTPVQVPSYATESFISKVLRTTGFPAATDSNAKQGKLWTSAFWDAAFGG
jgi:ABC-type nitrate/sulfonate/bicarbonate transport system substrate-binding protein